VTPELSTVVIRTNASGVPQAIVLDGIVIEHVENARIEYDPQRIARVVFTVFVGEIRTEVVVP
jgi:hypothetical protein